MTGIPQNEVYDTSICFMLEGVAQRHCFSVTANEAARIQAVLDRTVREDAGSRQFLVFESLNGWTFAVRIAAIEAMRILQDPIEDEPQFEPAEPMMMLCHFADGRESLSASPIHPEEVATLLLDLEAGIDAQPRRFISLKDEDDEWLYLGVEHIRLIQISTDLAEEGHKAIGRDLQSGADDSAL